MIDIRKEHLLPAHDLPAYLESRGYGKKVSRRTVQRWIEQGSDGARLEAVRIGGRLMTSLEAVQRWVAAQNVSVEIRDDTDLRSPTTDGLQGRLRQVEVMPEAEAKRVLVEHRLEPTELDKLIDSLTQFSDSTRRQAAGALFRAGLRTSADLRAVSLDVLLQAKGVGPRSKPIVQQLRERVDELTPDLPGASCSRRRTSS